MQQKNYYTLEEAAKILDITVDEIKDSIFGRERIIPTCYIAMPVQAGFFALDINGGNLIEEIVDFTGLVDIYGLKGHTREGVLTLLPDDLETLLSSTQTIFTLFHLHESGQWVRCILREEYAVNVDKLLINCERVAELEKYTVVKHVTTINNSSLTEPADPTTGDNGETQSPGEYILSLRGKSEPDEVIAALLKSKFPEMTSFDGMKLIDPERVRLWEESPSKQGRPKEWFNYRVKKGTAVLEERENMTVS